jgi:hypothetical protein
MLILFFPSLGELDLRYERVKWHLLSSARAVSLVPASKVAIRYEFALDGSKPRSIGKGTILFKW